MKKINYSYSNNGEFPVRYIRRSSYAHLENVYLDETTGEEIEIVKPSILKSLENLSHGFTTSGVSVATRRKIAKACRVLGIAATPQKVRNSKNEYITHLCMFVTLTLPSEQMTEDKFVTKEILGYFLDKCRKLGLLTNYVWRAEKQKNGNIHYHILTDTFTSFSLISRVWLLALRKSGHLQAYTDKFSNMSFAEYSKQNFNREKSPQQIAAAFANGTRQKWQNPPAAHTKYISDISSVSKYVSKYVSKNDSGDNIVEGRIWGCSTSVSAATKLFCSDRELSEFWYNVGASMMNRQVIEHDYFSIVIFKFNSLIAWFADTKDYVVQLLREAFSPCQYYRNSIGLFS